MTTANNITRNNIKIRAHRDVVTFTFSPEKLTREIPKLDSLASETSYEKRKKKRKKISSSRRYITDLSSHRDFEIQPARIRIRKFVRSGILTGFSPHARGSLRDPMKFRMTPENGTRVSVARARVLPLRSKCDYINTLCTWYYLSLSLSLSLSFCRCDYFHGSWLRW